MAAIKPAPVSQGVQGVKGVQGIKRSPAKSSFIAEFSYDYANQTLTTQLKSGAIYQHKDVSPGEWVALQNSQSQSRFWADAIRGQKLSVRVKSAKAPNSEVRRTGRK